MSDQAIQLSARIAALEAENAELRAVVEKLPKTADGVAMMVDDETWVRRLDGDEPQRARVIAIHNVGGKMLVDVDELHASNDHYSLTTLLRLALPYKCFSTREAALAAQGRAEEAGR